MIEEVNVGMAIYSGSEIVERTNIRAGLIKFASDYHVIDDNAEKLPRPLPPPTLPPAPRSFHIASAEHARWNKSSFSPN